MAHKGLIRRFGKYLRAKSGAATVEFVIIFPVLIWIVFSTFELGWMTTRQMMFDRSVNLTIRDLRLGKIANPTHEGLKNLVCQRATILRDCVANIHMELVPVPSLQDGLPQTSTQCVDRTGDIVPVENFTAGDEADIMFVRVCVVVDPLMPGMGIGAGLNQLNGGGFAMVAFSAFKREP
ncbi:MAG: pilus assembly protein [Rhodobacteraceae bacterium]|nr:pilus assembly protein [Paracoccaceae bacterium]